MAAIESHVTCRRFGPFSLSPQNAKSSRGSLRTPFLGAMNPRLVASQPQYHLQRSPLDIRRRNPDSFSSKHISRNSRRIRASAGESNGETVGPRRKSEHDPRVRRTKQPQPASARGDPKTHGPRLAYHPLEHLPPGAEKLDRGRGNNQLSLAEVARTIAEVGCNLNGFLLQSCMPPERHRSCASVCAD